MSTQPTIRGSRAEQDRTPRPGNADGEQFVGLLLGSGVFLVQILALVPGLFPFVGLVGVVLFVLALPLLALGLAATIVLAPFYLAFRLIARRGR
jgi:hypothetical protein